MGRIGHCRQHILESGTQVLYQKGYNGTGVKEITLAAGVPKGSFYNHFESKEAFVIEALNTVAAQQHQEAENILLDELNSPKTRLFNFFDHVYSQLEQCDFQGGCIVANLCLEMSDENQPIRETVEAIFRKQCKLISRCLSDAVASSELKTEQSTDDLAIYIHYALEGAIMGLKASKNSKVFSIFRLQMQSLLNS